jgi:hypothetical protein
VVRRNGKLGGYQWGVQRKQKLLKQEHAGHNIRPIGRRSIKV